MLSPGRTLALSNARISIHSNTPLLNRRFSSSIAVTSRSNVYFGFHKNDFLRSNGDNSAQVFLCLQQRRLNTKAKASDAKPSDSSNNDREHKLERKVIRKMRDIVANSPQFGSFQKIRNAILMPLRKLAGTNRFLLMIENKFERLIPEHPMKAVALFFIVRLVKLTLVLGLLYLAYKLVRRVWLQKKNALFPTAVDNDLEK
ncbi:hypothetical protein Ddc_15406 [Ditylenchus destructor]|nr:hypothetical protein Ddc_15406 [Ditylenchus destructor]